MPSISVLLVGAISACLQDMITGTPYFKIVFISILLIFLSLRVMKLVRTRGLLKQVVSKEVPAV